MITIDRKGFGSSSYTVSHFSINFGLVSGPADGWKQLKALESCRDYINDYLIRVQWENKYPASRGVENFPMDRLRLLIGVTLAPKIDYEGIRPHVYMAKRIINMYEDLAGFKQPSTIAKVKYDSKSYKCWMLSGPKEWLLSSHFVSMITLIIRIVVTTRAFLDVKDIDDVERVFAKLCKSPDKEGGTLGGYDDLRSYLPRSWPKFRAIMANYDRFEKLGRETIQPETKVGGWHSDGGIVSLCSCSTGVKKLSALVTSIAD